MDTHNTRKRLTLIGAAVLLSIVMTHAQDTSRAGSPNSAGAPRQAQADAGRQAMMADMQAAQKRLDDLVAQMNAAKGSDKVDRIAAVVNQLAAMHKRMSGMMMQT